jgi:hypothetical protein
MQYHVLILQRSTAYTLSRQRDYTTYSYVYLSHHPPFHKFKSSYHLAMDKQQVTFNIYSLT